MHFLIFIFLILVISGCSYLKEQEDSSKEIQLTISAAASLRDALTEIKKEFELDHSIKVVYNYGSSGALSRQIEQGAPVDLFFSADLESFKQLGDQQYIASTSKKNLLSNELVIIVPKESSLNSLEESSKINSFAIGTPETVPAGKYAKEYLVSEGLWNQFENKFIYAKDVKQVLSYVETNNVDVGIVYRTDALRSKSVNVLSNIKKELTSPIVYPVGVLKNTNNPKEAETFYFYLQSEKAIEIFKKYGFTSID
ncbi:molybdate ABC transporter substrate-binding protein [Metabacillus herbersteinensis]|uniref:Molybdate ABC transporter substrate-binding protein n=1 Tax=Metabacillus herbersteinensis TaxID=283816 RepID=A0ABV6GAM4_9BACI